VSEPKQAAKAKCVKALHFGTTHSSAGQWTMDWAEPRHECSVCRTRWETRIENGITYCANCGAEVEDEDGK